MNTHILAEDVRKIYQTGRDQVEAVSHVSFSVQRGEFVAILGASGCGKSTLLMMCAGLESITAGRVVIDGEVVAEPRADVGIMFQDSTLLPWKSVLENVLFPVKLQKRRLEEHAARARDLIDRVGLSGFEEKKPHQLSGGMRQRVSICRALVTDPDILLMDEPFSALDAMTRDEMNDVLLDIWDHYPKTGLFVTHSIREAVYLADRVIMMGGRPATIMEDLRVPFRRPRDPSLGERADFNELCTYLRDRIEQREGGRSRSARAA